MKKSLVILAAIAIGVIGEKKLGISEKVEKAVGKIVDLAKKCPCGCSEGSCSCEDPGEEETIEETGEDFAPVD